MEKAVSYCRVSTKKQGDSGLGLEAQQRAIDKFAKQNSYKIICKYVEVASGKKNNRPEVLKAISDCKENNAVLLVATTSRLSRCGYFTAHLIKFGPKYILVDNPNANKVMKYILAAFAEDEGDLISTRTIDGLRSASIKGIKFGTGVTKTHLKQRRAYKLFAKRMRPLIKAEIKKGFKTVRELRDSFNKTGYETFRGGARKWHLSTVHRLLKELKILTK
jgi:DNA invertase Pin-like site-specific DNA recombinase